MENDSTSNHRIFLPMSPLDISMYILRPLPLPIMATLPSELMLDTTSLGCTKLEIIVLILNFHKILLKNLLIFCVFTYDPLPFTTLY